jgi:hypothetical protein
MLPSTKATVLFSVKLGLLLVEIESLETDLPLELTFPPMDLSILLKSTSIYVLGEHGIELSF